MTSRFILKRLDYSLSTSMHDRNPELIDWWNQVHYTAPNITRVHLGIRMHATCVHAQISGHVVKDNKVKINV